MRLPSRIAPPFRGVLPLIALLSLVPACSGGSCSPAREASDRAENEPENDSTTASKTNEGEGPERRPTDEVVGELQTAEPLEAQTGRLERTRTLLETGTIRFGDDSMVSGSPWLTLSLWNETEQGRPDAVLAVDPTTGRRREIELDPKLEGTPWRRSHPRLLALAPESGLEHVAFYDLSSGARHDPSFALPDGVERDAFDLETVEVLGATDGSNPRVWLSGRYRANNYAAVWSPSESNATFREISVPYNRLEVLGRHGDRYFVTDYAYMTGTGRTGIQGGCAFWSVPDRGDVSCRLELRHGDRPDELKYLGEGWVALSTWGTEKPRLIGPGGRQLKLGLGMCSEPFFLALRTGTPGAVASCFGSPSSGGQPYEFWSPDRHFRFETTDSARADRRVRSRSRATATRREPVVWNWWGEEATRHARWFDFRTGRYWNSPSVFPLAFGYRRSRSPVLATDAKSGASLELFTLDFDAGTRRRIANYDDCPGRLRERDRAGTYALVDCVTRTHPGRFRFKRVWSELVDLDSGKHHRVEAYPHAVYPDGDVVVSNRPDDRPGHYKSSDQLWIVAPVSNDGRAQ